MSACGVTITVGILPFWRRHLRSFRSVERAKNILMEKRNLDEEAAYHFMRRQAMSQRVSVGAVAAAIIDSRDIIG